MALEADAMPRYKLGAEAGAKLGAEARLKLEAEARSSGINLLQWD